jgi:bifunctional UDP-N-acetylglucosamine pyrophosphorylase/glucosamine-1-phosphate N-acetyltransferase
VVIADETLIAAGSTIVNDVKKGEMGIARSRQTNKEKYYQEWLKKIGK